MRSFIFLCFFIALQACSIKHHEVIYKNESTVKPYAKNTVRLFMDKGGCIYDSLGKASSANQVFARQEKVNEINDRLESGSFKKVVFLIHGYNMTYRQNLYPYAMLQERISGLSNDEILYVRVFWDGLTDKHTQNVAEGKKLYFKNRSRLRDGFTHPAIWKQANYNALYVGRELRQLFNGLNTTTIYVVTHSLGARVISSALLNLTVPVEKSKYSEYNNAYLKQRKIPLPKQTFYVGMLAPAIDGMTAFQPLFEDDIINQTSYNFVVGYNENDKVLRKFSVFGEKSANLFGDTSLGTLASDIEQIQDLFEENNKRQQFIPIAFNQSLGAFPQTKHAPLFYYENPAFEELIRAMKLGQ